MYPKYKFACGCIIDCEIMRPYLKFGKKSSCPNHPGNALKAKTYVCGDCGVGIEGTICGSSAPLRYCPACKQVRNNASALRRYYRAKAGVKLPPIPHPEPIVTNPVPPVKPGPGHPCLRCEIHISGESKLGRTCHYCNHRIEWADAQERRWG